jgi:hypothetical protein
MPRKEDSRVNQKDAGRRVKSADTIFGGKSATPRANTLQEAEEQRRASPYEEWSKHDLYERAVEVGIEGRARMSKKVLINTLRDY